MDPSNPNSTPPNSSPDPGDDPILHPLRFVRELWPDPERALAYIALNVFGWTPAKFVGNYRHLTLKEIARQFERLCIAAGDPAPVAGYWWQKLENILRHPPRDVSGADAIRSQGDYALHEFFVINPEAEVLAWVHAGEARIRLARERAVAGDCKFAAFWSDNLLRLRRMLNHRIRRDLCTVADVTQLTWLAVHLAHDTNDDWEFGALLTLSRELHRRLVAAHGPATDDLNEMDRGRRAGETPSPPRPPDYVVAALLKTVFDGACPPHEVLAFLFRWLLRYPPRKIVRLFAPRSLYELNSFIFAAYLPGTNASHSVVRECFDRFDARLARRYRDLIRHRRRLRKHRRVHDTVSGLTLLSDYFKNRTPRAQAKEISKWLESVRLHLDVEKSIPGTPLYDAFGRWRDGLADDEADDSPEGSEDEASPDAKPE